MCLQLAQEIHPLSAEALEAKAQVFGSIFAGLNAGFDVNQMDDKQPLPRDKFSARIRNLLKPEYGAILKKGQKKG